MLLQAMGRARLLGAELPSQGISENLKNLKAKEGVSGYPVWQNGGWGGGLGRGVGGGGVHALDSPNFFYRSFDPS